MSRVTLAEDAAQPRCAPSPALCAADEYARLANIGDLWGRGWSVIPLRARDKRPAINSWLEYQKRPATYAELERWFADDPALNIGIVTGHVSGIFVLDADTPEAVAWAEQNLPISDMRVRTAKGLHLYYRYSVGSKLRNKARIRVADGGRIGLDIRAEGGYVVGPGSVHPSGFVYVREGAGGGRL